MMRRFVLAGAVLTLTACIAPQLIAATPAPTANATATAAASASARPLSLTPLGSPRSLPAKILGASAESLIEHITDDPRKVAAVKATAPGVIRFPGGSQSNYYNWRDGQLHFDLKPNSSSYYRFWAALAPRVAQAHPNGMSYEDYAAFAGQIGEADIIIVPNLETSSVDEQAAWFRKLASEGLAPNNIELGNEFWVAMGGDPNVMRQWPDEKSSQSVMQQYASALRPLAGANGKFAIQASAASFTVLPTESRPFYRRLLAWDANLTPADWFQAVTAHLYPNPQEMMAAQPPPSPQRLFELLMGRSDQGIDRAIGDIAAKLPGKEIWVTEWSPRGGSPVNLDRPDLDSVPPQMNAQLIARTELALLRHPEVTKAQYFTLYFSAPSVFQIYVPVGDQFQPMAPAVVLGWFDDAANGGATFQRMVEPNGQSVADLGPFKEAYHPVEGGLFKSARRSVLIIQNASAEARVYSPPTRPSQAEALVTPDLASTAHVPAQVITLDANAPIVLPPLSIVRLIWQ